VFVCLFGYLLAFDVSAGREVEGDSRGYRSAEEQARELTRSIRREVNKLSEKWNALIDRSDQWQRKLDDSLAVSEPFESTPAVIDQERCRFLKFDMIAAVGTKFEYSRLCDTSCSVL
jgi:hypothetical protein